MSVKQVGGFRSATGRKASTVEVEMTGRPRRDPRRLSKEQVADVFRKAGYPDLATEALRALPDEVDIDGAEQFCEKHGIFPSDLISRMGGSP